MRAVGTILPLSVASARLACLPRLVIFCLSLPSAPFAVRPFALPTPFFCEQNYGALKRVAFGVIAHSLSPEEIRILRAEFQKVRATFVAGTVRSAAFGEQDTNLYDMLCFMYMFSYRPLT